MSKTYKGWELMKSISDGEIKKGSKIKNNSNMIFEFNGSNFRSVDNCDFLVDDYDEIDFVTTEFELIEDETDIDNIKELYINDKTKSVGKDAIENWTGRSLDITFANKINEILQSVKQIDKRLKKLED